MAKLVFYYGTMDSSKTLNLLAKVHNCQTLEIPYLVFKPSVDDRFGKTIIKSRAMCEILVADCIKPDDSITNRIIDLSLTTVFPKYLIIDEVQFFTKNQIEELFRLSKIHDITILCYGLKTDFRGELFEGSKRLIELADEFEEITTLCHVCKTDKPNKARFNVRYIDNKPTLIGEQILIGDENYKPVCAKCFCEITGLGMV